MKAMQDQMRVPQVQRARFHCRHHAPGGAVGIVQVALFQTGAIVGAPQQEAFVIHAGLGRVDPNLPVVQQAVGFAGKPRGLRHVQEVTFGFALFDAVLPTLQGGKAIHVMGGRLPLGRKAQLVAGLRQPGAQRQDLGHGHGPALRRQPGGQPAQQPARIAVIDGQHHRAGAVQFLQLGYGNGRDVMHVENRLRLQETTALRRSARSL
ncbi:hypothetical protein [Alcaligenes sp. Marseille-Q7550]